MWCYGSGSWRGVVRRSAGTTSAARWQEGRSIPAPPSRRYSATSATHQRHRHSRTPGSVIRLSRAAPWPTCWRRRSSSTIDKQCPGARCRGIRLSPPQRPGRRLRPSQATSHGVTGLLPGHAQAPRALRTKPRAAGSRHRGLASRDGRQRWCLSKALSELKSWPQARQPASAPRGSLTTGASWSCVGSPPAAGRGGDGASCVAPGQSSPPETPPG
jgi:hypothetical protein